MKAIKLFTAAIALATLATSCVKDGDKDNELTFSFAWPNLYTPGNFTYVTDADGVSKVTGEAQITYDYDLVHNALDMKFYSLPLGDRTVQFQVAGLRYETSNYGYYVTKVGTSSLNLGGVISTVTNFNVYSFAPAADRPQDFLLSVGMKMDDTQINVIQKKFTFYGTTNVKTLATGSMFTTTSPEYVVTLDPSTMTARVDMLKATFADRMPQMDIVMLDIPFTVSADAVNLSIAEVVPQLHGTPVPSYKITDLNITYNFGQGMSVNFRYAGQFDVTTQLGPVPPSLI